MEHHCPVFGFPNVGKSSLINMLKWAKMCAVAAQPGSLIGLQLSPEWTLTRYRALTAALWLDKGLLQPPFRLM